ncbi:MAG: RAMP superfamily CRISPR-associated protein [Anaerolineae bacterium]
MTYDFAAHVVQQFHSVDQAIRRRFQQETQGLSKTRAEEQKKRITAEEVSGFAQRITGGDLRVMDTILSLIQMHHADYKEGIRQAWMDGATKSLAPSVQMSLFAEVSAVSRRLSTVLPTLPSHSWYISLPVRLAQPFTSKDDSEMHVLENPICRERVFGGPMVRPSTWKGNLRWMAVMAGLDEEVRERLFGNETDEEEEFRAGRLLFFPTFFDRIDFEVLTPLDRERRFPETGPILLECVRHHPDDRARPGEFGLLYLAPSSAWQSLVEMAKQAAADLKHTAAILTEMLLSYGFSAKKTSGFGVIEDNFRDQQGRKQGVLAMVGIALPEVVGTTKSEPARQPVTSLPFGSCAEMRYQAERLAQALEEVSYE